MLSMMVFSPSGPVDAGRYMFRLLAPTPGTLSRAQTVGYCWLLFRRAPGFGSDVWAFAQQKALANKRGERWSGMGLCRPEAELRHTG
jgi:hypothetical protein